MQSEPYCLLGHLKSTKVGVEPSIGGQDILIQQSDIGRSLANLLALENVEFVQQEGIAYWRIPHNHEVDTPGRTPRLQLRVSCVRACLELVRRSDALPGGADAIQLFFCIRHHAIVGADIGLSDGRDVGVVFGPGP